MDPSLRTFLSARGVEVHEVIAGGYQSAVHRGVLGEADVAVKVVDARLSDAGMVLCQATLARDLAAIDTRVVAPIAIGGEVVLVTGHHLITVSPLVAGRAPDLDDLGDAEWLGRQLARLHSSMRRVSSELPLVASLRAGAGSLPDGDEQLIHGDPGAANFLRDGDDAHVLDLGDAGRGTPAYDVSLALFSRRFEVWSRGWPTLADDAAPEAILYGYEQEAGHRLSSEELADGLTIRREALAWWIDHPHEAPVGIRTASPEWRGVLARFVDDERQS